MDSDYKRLQSIIDYIIGKQTNSIKVEDVRVQRGASCGSDHYLVRAKVYIPYTPSSERIPTNPNNKQNPEFKQNSAEKTHRYNLYRLSDPSVSFLYKLRLSQNLINIDDSTPEALYSNIKRAVHQAAIESIGEKNLTTERSRHWISDKLKQLIDDKKKAYNLWLNTRDTEDRKQYVRCNREVKKEVKAAKNEYWEKKCEELDTYLGSTRSRESWRMLKALRSNEINRTSLQLIPSRQWHNHYKSLLHETRQEFNQHILPRKQRSK